MPDAPGTTRILGIDPGEKRVGLAVSDPDCKVALGLPTFERKTGSNLVDHLRQLLRAYDVGRVVVGHPITMRGGIGVEARRAAGLARRLRRDLAVEVELWDERLTTVAGERVLRGTRAPKSARDRLAATLLLQSYLDRRNAEVP
jgi:putative Holliday junction resolvase